MNLALGIGRALGIVGHDDEGLAQVLAEPDHEVHDRLRRLLVEVTGGLVADDDGGVGHDGAGDGDSLLLAARELTRVVVVPVGDPDELHGGLHLLVAVLGGHAVKQKRKFDVLVGCEHGHEVVELEDVADVHAPPVGELGPGQRGDVRAADDELPAAGPVDPRDEVEERGLAATRGAHEGEEVARGHVEVELLQGRDGVVALLVRLGEPAALDQRRALRSCSCVSVVRSHKVSRRCREFVAEMLWNGELRG